MAVKLILVLLLALTDYQAELQRIDTELAGAAGVKRAYLLYLRASLTNDFDDFRAAETAIDEAGPPLARANLAFKLHKLDAAKRDADRVLLADIAMQEGRNGEARRAYESLPATWDNLARLANYHAKTGHREKADELYERAEDDITVKQMRDFAWVELQRGIIDFDRKRYAEALAHYDRANAAWSGWWLIDEHRAEVLHRLGRTDEAVALYRDVIARTHKPELISVLAAILHSEELFAEADARFAEEMKLYPEAAIGHYIEHLLRRGGDRKTILELAERNYALRPNSESKALLERAKRNAGVPAG